MLFEEGRLDCVDEGSIYQIRLETLNLQKLNIKAKRRKGNILFSWLRLTILSFHVLIQVTEQ